jgi:hypothetical protein
MNEPFRNTLSEDVVATAVIYCYETVIQGDRGFTTDFKKDKYLYYKTMPHSYSLRHGIILVVPPLLDLGPERVPSSKAARSK